MSMRVRLAVFAVAGLGVVALLLWGVSGLAPFGHYPGPYGDVLNALAVAQRHVTNIVAAVNFDYRGVDTIGEEFIFFTCVVAVVVLMRRERDEQEIDEPEHRDPDNQAVASDAVRAFCLALVGPAVLLGLYIVTHGALTPGGGFQGGTILGGAFILIFLAGEYAVFRAVVPTTRTEIGDAIGAGGFVVVGLAGLIEGAAYLTNVLPLGTAGKLNSAGTIPLINLAVGLEVGAGLLLLFSEFFEQALLVRPAKAPAEQQDREQGQGQEGDQASAPKPGPGT